MAGYSIFNDGSIRDYQFKSAQWMMGKNFDRSGSIGPEFVTADELPEGARGLRLTTRLNGKVVQDANTRDMIFDVATLVAVCSEPFELQPGDIIISRHALGRGPGAQAAAVDARRRCLRGRDRRPGPAVESGRRRALRGWLRANPRAEGRPGL